MVSPIDGPSPPPGSYLPVPVEGRAVVPYTRTDGDDAKVAGRRDQDRAARTGADAVAVPVDAGERRRDPRDNPFLPEGEAVRRPLFASRPSSLFLAQTFGQDADAPGRSLSEAAAGRYRAVQETVDRYTARRTGRPGVDVVT